MTGVLTEGEMWRQTHMKKVSVTIKAEIAKAKTPKVQANHQKVAE